MYVLKVTNGYDSFKDSTEIDNDDINIVLKILLLSIFSRVLVLSLIRLIVWTTVKPFLANK